VKDIKSFLEDGDWEKHIFLGKLRTSETREFKAKKDII
jgi:hypothetical protein